MREHAGKTPGRRRGGQQSGPHDQWPPDGLRGDGGGKPGGARVLPGQGGAGPAAVRRPAATGCPNAVVPGGSDRGGHGGW